MVLAMMHYAGLRGPSQAYLSSMVIREPPPSSLSLSEGSSLSLLFVILIIRIFSGDGTLRKSPDAWKTWTPAGGIDLHTLQARGRGRCRGKGSGRCRGRVVLRQACCHAPKGKRDPTRVRKPKPTRVPKLKSIPSRSTPALSFKIILANPILTQVEIGLRAASLLKADLTPTQL